jgi:hypothetical protein
MKDIFLEYKNQREILFVFGAGASIADGCVLQYQILPKLFSNEFSNVKPLENLKNFIFQNFEINDEKYPNLESVFGFMDYFINKRESLNKDYTHFTILNIKEVLIRFIHQVISIENESKGIYKKFWEKISKTDMNLSIITMNYDTLLDESFDFLFPKTALIDYCINFLNYEKGDKIDPFNWWSDVRKPFSTEWLNEKIFPRPIKILKIHGSINWKYCNCCNQVLLTPWDTKIDLNKQKFIVEKRTTLSLLNKTKEVLTCPIDDNVFDTFIIPPSHIKELNHPVISKLFDEASFEIRNTKKIVFVGYSFPEADVHIKALFKKNLQINTLIEVIDPLLDEIKMKNYTSLNNDVQFRKISFEEYIENVL